MRRILLLILTGILWGNALNYAQQVSALTRKFVTAPAVRHALTGIDVREIPSGKSVVSRNADRLFVPASTLKLLYVFSALDELGDAHTRATLLLITGPVKNDTLKGHVIIRSEGDPSFGGAADAKSFRRLAEEMSAALHRLDIKVIDGNLELQLPANPYPAHGSWPIEDIGNYYGTGYWGFNFLDNTYYLYLDARQPGRVPEIVRTEPSIPRLHIYNLAVTGPPGSDDTAYLYGDPTSFTRTLIGSVPATDTLYRLKGGIPYPPLTFLWMWKDRLENEGISLTGKWFVRPKHITYPREQTIWSHTSPPLKELARHTLNKSVNLYSEAMARWVIEKDRMQSDRYLNKDSLNAYFRRRGFTLIDLEDGSGLAPDNLIAPSELTAFLVRRVEQDGLERVLDILPHAGEEGYAKYFLKGSPVQNRVWVKSGSVSKVRNYAGIFRGKSGKYYAFAVMVNHFDTSHKEVKRAIERYVESLINAL
ncbi:MAG: D-alanyl-D-alanine carboxypeptidase/D-alanyl-D-alanine-endopeptidase [Chlorobi bacterium]|nr:D-alanyl-D-alanine carboxypeptidase/D-alanyl-D-alanine-endopeptidase [Chlorobiota bacterium]